MLLCAHCNYPSSLHGCSMQPSFLSQFASSSALLWPKWPQWSQQLQSIASGAAKWGGGQQPQWQPALAVCAAGIFPHGSWALVLWALLPVFCHPSHHCWGMPQLLPHQRSLTCREPGLDWTGHLPLEWSPNVTHPRQIPVRSTVPWVSPYSTYFLDKCRFRPTTGQRRNHQLFLYLVFEMRGRWFP